MRIIEPRDLGLAVRTRRHELGWSQHDLASAAGVSRSWIVEFESGKARSEFDLVLRAVDALGLVMEVSDDPGGSLSGVTDRDRVDLDDVLAEYVDGEPGDDE